MKFLSPTILAKIERYLESLVRSVHCARFGHRWMRHQQAAVCTACGKRAYGLEAQTILRTVELTDDEFVNTFAIGKQGFDLPQSVVFPTEVAYSNELVEIGIAFSEQMSSMMLEIDWRSVEALTREALDRLRSEHDESVPIDELLQAARNLAVRRLCNSVCVSHGWHRGKFVKLFTSYVFRHCQHVIMLNQEASK